MSRVLSLSSEHGENETLESVEFRVLRLHMLDLSEFLSKSFGIDSFINVYLVIHMLDFHLNTFFLFSLGSKCVYSSESGSSLLEFSKSDLTSSESFWNSLELESIFCALNKLTRVQNISHTY